jgi:uncharacterized membrane protein
MFGNVRQHDHFHVYYVFHARELKLELEIPFLLTWMTTNTGGFGIMAVTEYKSFLKSR